MFQVLRNMRRVMTATREDSKAESSSFLLDDDHSRQDNYSSFFTFGSLLYRLHNPEQYNSLIYILCKHSIPFSVEDITNSIEENDLLDVKPAEELVKKPAFQFLKD